MELQKHEEQKNLRIDIENLYNQNQPYSSDKESLSTPSPRVFDSSKMVSNSVEGL